MAEPTPDERETVVRFNWPEPSYGRYMQSEARANYDLVYLFISCSNYLLIGQVKSRVAGAGIMKQSA